MTYGSLKRQHWKTGLLIMALALSVTALGLWYSPGRDDLPISNLYSLILNHPSSQVPLSGPAYLVLGKKIPLNLAMASDLVALPGVGPGRAEAIVKWRRKNGPFQELGELERIPGIGPKTLFQIQGYLTLEKEIIKDKASGFKGISWD